MTAPPRAGVLFLLAAGAGLSAANLYYNQPMLGLLAEAFGEPPGRVGLVPMLTQAGYAAGILGFAPLGDRLDRRRVILVKAAALAVALALTGAAPSFAALLAGSFFVGLLSTIAQDFVPAAAALAPPASSGRVVGRVMTGLLTGILLSRVISGWVGAHPGWRTMFFGASAVTVVLTAVAARALPRFEPTTSARYFSLLASIAGLAARMSPLRRAALAQGLLSVAFSGFWTTLALVLRAPPFELGSEIAGAFGLAGAAGALGASLFGGLADRRGPEAVIRVGAALVIGSFLLMGLVQGSLVVLALGALAFDLGTSGALIGHQTVIYGLEPAARSRTNAVLVTSMFIGMAAGSLLASQAFGRFGWSGVCALGAGSGALALALRLMPARGVE